MKDIITLAEENGFEHYIETGMQALVPLKEVRAMCEVNRCGKYGASWSCPPACGTLEQAAAQLKKYTHCVLVQSTVQLADAFDYEGIKQLEHTHKKRFESLSRQARVLYPHCLPLSAGTCTVCHKCTYPTKPCRYPQKRMSSMEAFGLWVSDVCDKAGLPYKYGEGTMTFTSCVLYKE